MRVDSLRAHGLVVALLGAALAGCGDDETTAAATTGPGSGPNDWSCLGSTTAEPFAGAYQATVIAVSFATSDGIEGVTVKLCDLADSDCANPIAEGTTDASGELELSPTIDAPFFVEASGDDIVTALVFFLTPPADTTVSFQLQALSPATLAGFLTAVGTTEDAARGHAGIGVQDCLLAPSFGATVEVSAADGDSTTAYFDGNVPDLELTATAGGICGVGNLPPGPATVTATEGASGDTIGTRAIFIRAGAISTVSVSPVPSTP